MFDTYVLNDKEVVVETAVTDATTTTVSINDIPLAQALVEIKTSKPKARVQKEQVINLTKEDLRSKKVEDDKEQEELKRCLEIILDDGDDVTINATPLSINTSIIDYKIYKEGKKSYF
nr:hypothetical protein [Tanacetum cinerariifolium]